MIHDQMLTFVCVRREIGPECKYCTYICKAYFSFYSLFTLHDSISMLIKNIRI